MARRKRVWGVIEGQRTGTRPRRTRRLIGVPRTTATRNREGNGMQQNIRHAGSRQQTALACAALLVLSVTGGVASAADLVSSPPEEPIRRRPPSFEYEQCANLCQIERDHGVTACMVADNPNKPDYRMPADCMDGGRKQYMACIAMCPADVGADQP